MQTFLLTDGKTHGKAAGPEQCPDCRKNCWLSRGRCGGRTCSFSNPDFLQERRVQHLENSSRPCSCHSGQGRPVVSLWAWRTGNGCCNGRTSSRPSLQGLACHPRPSPSTRNRPQGQGFLPVSWNSCFRMNGVKWTGGMRGTGNRVNKKTTRTC